MKKTGKTVVKLLSLTLTLCLLLAAAPFGAAADAVPYVFSNVRIGRGVPFYAGGDIAIEGRLENLPGELSDPGVLTGELYNGSVLVGSERMYLSFSGLFFGEIEIPDTVTAGSYSVRLVYSGVDGSVEYREDITIYKPDDVIIAVTAPYQAAVGEWFRLEGTVTFADDRPVANCEVMICRDANFGYCWGRYTDSNGFFAFDYKSDTESVAPFYVKTYDDRYSSNIAHAVTYIYGDNHTVTVSSGEHGAAACSTGSARLGDPVTLTATPEAGYRLKEWQVISGDVTVENDRFIMPAGDVSLNAVFELKPCTVTIDPGAVGEPIVVTVPYGTVFYSMLSEYEVYETLEAMDTDDDHFYQITTMPKESYSGWEDFEDDAVELYTSIITGDMTVHAVFMEKLHRVSLSVVRPVSGEVVSGDWETQTNAPQLLFAPDAHCGLLYPAVWETGDNLFEGVIREGETYETTFWLMPDYGYWLDDASLTVSVGGGTVAEYYGQMAVMVRLAVTAAGVPVLGDANGDGAVNVRDVTAIQRHLGELQPLTGAYLTAADVDGDGSVTIDDATILQEYLAEFEIAYPIGV